MSETDAATVSPANAEMLRAWDGDEGAYWAANADYYDRAIATHHQSLLEAAAIRPDEHVLDVGCGTGQTTRDAARAATDGAAVGVDLSSAMLAVARARATAEGVANATFEHADAQVHSFAPAAFDVMVSRTGTMFFGDPDAAFANIARALRPGGRLAMTTWQPIERNEWLRALSGALADGRDMPGPTPGAPGPFGLSDPERVRSLLEGAGFVDVAVDGHEAGMWFGTDAADAHRFVLGQLGWMLEGLDDDGRARASDALMATLQAHETADGVVFGSAAWLTTATRRT